jgi:hypothetical protein
MRAYFAAVVLSFNILTACGSAPSSTATGDAAITVSFKGVVKAFPIPSNESLPAFTNLRMRLYDGNGIWPDPVGGDAPVASSLYDAGVPSASNNCAASGCAFLDNSQNIAGTGPNLVSLISGSVAASQMLWAPVYTNLVDSQSLTNAQQHRGVIYANAPAYAISLYGLGKLAVQLGVADANTLLERGLIIGMVRGKDPTDFSGGLPPAVAGAKINLTAEQSAAVSLYYPNDTYTNAALAVSTNADGVFYLLGKSAGATLAPTTLDINATGSSYLWTNRPIALIHGSVVVAPLPALP